jgi:peptidoglycan hydrolase-like protein with peptidoglycan-binding domain
VALKRKLEPRFFGKRHVFQRFAKEGELRALYKGRVGNDVRYLQWYLGVPVTGTYDNATFNAVRKKQAETGLVTDGSCGPATQKKWGLTDYIVHIYERDKVRFYGTPYGSKTYPVRTLKQWAYLEGLDRVYNLAFFSMTAGTDKYGAIKGRTVTYLKANGKDVGYGGVPQRIKVNEGNVCGGYKAAILNGQRQAVSAWGARARNANGLLKDGRYFQVQSIYKVTERAIADFMMPYKVDIMLLQDGGGSVGFYDARTDSLIAAELEGANGRPVASVMGVIL